HCAPPYDTILHAVNSSLPCHIHAHPDPHPAPEAPMSIWFGWTRSQAGSAVADDVTVDDAPSATPDVVPESESAASGPRAALPDPVPGPDARPRAADAPRQPTHAEFEIWELHQRVIELERRANRILAKSSARREHHEALVAEADALNKLGFQSFESFA